MKKVLKNIVVAILGAQVRSLRKKHQFKVVGVVGSIGKTSTKLAIAQSLNKNLRVRWQDGNYNDITSVPLIFFGHDIPSLTNPFAWLKIFVNNFKQTRGDYPYDVVVVELGTDGPNQISEFKKYLHLDLAVVTAVAPEHMEFFADLAAVAKEEISVTSFAGQTIFNSDLVPEEFHQMFPTGSLSYALSASVADFYIANVFHSAGGFEGDIKQGNEIYLHFTHEVVSETQLYSMLAAVVVARQLGLKNIDILAGIAAITPVSGRLRRLRGINDSVIIDDTYNASPEAVTAALQTLYKAEAEQRVAILGNMNELGAISVDEHKKIGENLDASKLNLVITIGPDANAHIAPAAQAKGIETKTFDNPYDAGEYLQGKIQPKAFVLAKGSQNGVYAEEAVKKILADPEDASKLVRQSSYWLARKEKSFKEKK